MSNKDKNITVLLGGWNNEAEISRLSGEVVYSSLLKMGYKANKLEFDGNVLENLRKLETDIVFNALHGQFGEDGRIQGLLDIAKLAYTHSGLLSSAICMNKILSKTIFESHHILMADSEILRKDDNINNNKIIDKIAKPFIIKPVDEGSSIGVEVILEDSKFDIAGYSWKHGDEIIIEKYIKGKEINVAILGQKAIGMMEVVPKDAIFYDYKSKYTSGMTDYIIPKISKDKKQEILDLALKCHNIAKCQDISRVEFLFDNIANKIYLLEINTHPGITDLSLVPKIAKNAGLSFDYIIEYLINNAGYNK